MHRVLHILKRWPCGGGMEYAAGLHRDGTDLECGDGKDSVFGLLGRSYSPWTPVGILRNRLQGIIESGDFELLLFYNGYGIDFVSSHRQPRWAYMHSDFPGLESFITYLDQFATGFLCVSDALLHKIKSIAPGKIVIKLPIPAPQIPHGIHLASLPEKSMTIGYSGRIQSLQKRLDRLPQFLELLDALNIPFKFELLGSGEMLENLARRYRGDNRIIFHGHKTGDAYWEILSRWKYMVFFSDYEGLPVALLEALRANVVPVYPDLYQGRTEIAELFPSAVYCPGNMEAAVKAIKMMESCLLEDSGRTFISAASELLGKHNPEAYFNAYREWKKMIGIPQHKGPGPSIPGYYPLWVYHRYISRLQHGVIQRG